MVLKKYNLGPAPQRCVAHMNDEAAAGRAERPRLAVRIGLYPIVTLEKQVPIMIGNLV